MTYSFCVNELTSPLQHPLVTLLSDLLRGHRLLDPCHKSSGLVIAFCRLEWNMGVEENRFRFRVITTTLVRNIGSKSPFHSLRRAGQDFIVGHARASFDQEFFIFGIEHGILRIRASEGFDGIP